MILVTGGAGFIGSHVCDKLLELGKQVVCVDNLNDYYDPKIKKQNIKHNMKNKNFVFYKESTTNFKVMEKIFAKHRFESVIHLAASAGVRASIKNPFLYEKTNLGGTLNLLELSRRFGIRKFIFGSSSSIYGFNKKTPFSETDVVESQTSPYAITKKAGEVLCRGYHNIYNLKIVCLRFFTVYGPRGRPDMAPLKFTDRISRGVPIDMYGDGSSARDYTYVADIVDGIIAALDKDLDFEIINLGDSRPINLKKFISLIEKAVGKKALIRQKSVPTGDVDITYADIKKAKMLLGYSPKVPLEEGLKKLVDWYSK